jgi:hypothetical protein
MRSAVACTDHYVAWETRFNLWLDYLKTAGVSGPAAAFAGDATHPDNLIFDIPSNVQAVGPNKAPVEGNNVSSPSGFGHPLCYKQPTAVLSPVR